MSDLITLNAFGYGRISDSQQSSIPEQKRWITEEAKRRGLCLVDTFVDEGISGDNFQRPGLMALRGALDRFHREGKPVPILLVWSTDRLSRGDLLDTASELQGMRRSGLTTIVTRDRDFDLFSGMDAVLYAIQSAFKDSAWLKTHSEKALNGMLDAARSGLWTCGTPPLGYRVVRPDGLHAGKKRRSGILAIDPETKCIVEDLFRLYLEGKSTVDLARWLQDRVRPPRAEAWAPVSLGGILRNQVYIGKQLFGRRSYGKHSRVSQNGVEPQKGKPGDNLDSAMVRQDESLRIIPDNVFFAVQARLQTGRRRSYHKSSTPLALSLLGKCGHCGGNLVCSRHHVGGRIFKRVACQKKTQQGKEYCPMGPGAASHDQVLRSILRTLKDQFVVDNAAERMAELASQQFDQAKQEMESRRAVVLKEITTIDKALGGLSRRLMIIAEDMVGDVQNAAREMKARRERLVEDLDRLEIQRGGIYDPAEFKAFLAAVAEAKADHPRLNELMRELIDGFTLHCKEKRGRITPDRVEIQLPEFLSSVASKANPTIRLCVVGKVLAEP